MIFLNRSRTGVDPWLDWKVRLFFLAAILALVGMARGWSWLVVLAILALFGGMALRFIGGRSSQEGVGHGSEDEVPGDRSSADPSIPEEDPRR